MFRRSIRRKTESTSKNERLAWSYCCAASQPRLTTNLRSYTCSIAYNESQHCYGFCKQRWCPTLTNGHITISTPVSNIQVDGDLSDWPSNVKLHHIGTTLVVCDATPNQEGFHGQFRVGHDVEENALFVAVEIEDDQIVLDGFGDEWNSRDGCEVFLSLDHQEDNTLPVQFVYRDKPSATYDNKENLEYAKAAKVARASDDNHLTYEWRIDLAALGQDVAQLRQGAVVGFDIAYVDRDTEENYAFYCSSPGRWKHVNSNTQGDLLIPPAKGRISRLAGTATWAQPNTRELKSLQIQSTDNASLFFQLPIASTGQFMVELPEGDYDVKATTGDASSTTTTMVSVRRDRFLDEPLVFEMAEPPVPIANEGGPSQVTYDISHGQTPVARFNKLGSEVGYTVRVSSDPISSRNLEGTRLLYILGPKTPFTEKETAAIVGFVRGGGSLLLVMDESRRTSLEKTQVNQLIQPFGLSLTSDTEYVHNCGGIAKAGEIFEADLEIPYSGGRAVEGGEPFAYLIDRDGNPSHPFGAFHQVDRGGRVAVLGEAMASLFLGTPKGERLSGTPRNYAETTYWGKDSEQFNASLVAWLLNQDE